MMLLFAFIFFICLWVDANSTDSGLTTKDVLAKWTFNGKDLLNKNIASTEFELLKSYEFTFAIKEEYELNTSCKFYASRIPKNESHPKDTCILATCNSIECHNIPLTFVTTLECVTSIAHELYNYGEKNFFHAQCALNNKVLPIFSVEVIILSSRSIVYPTSQKDPQKYAEGLNKYQKDIKKALEKKNVKSHEATVNKYKTTTSQNLNKNLVFISTPLSSTVEEIANESQTDLTKSPKSFKLTSPTLKDGFRFLGQFFKIIEVSGVQKSSFDVHEIDITDNSVPSKLPFSCSADEFCLIVNELYHLPIERDQYNAALPYAFDAGLENNLSFRLSKNTYDMVCLLSATYQSQRSNVSFDLAYCYHDSCTAPLRVYFGEDRIPGLKTWHDIYAVQKFELMVNCTNKSDQNLFILTSTIPFKISAPNTYNASDSLPLLSESELEAKVFALEGTIFKESVSHFVATENDPKEQPKPIKFGVQHGSKLNSDGIYTAWSDNPPQPLFNLSNHQVLLRMHHVKFVVSERVLNLFTPSQFLRTGSTTIYLNKPEEAMVFEFIPSIRNDISGCKIKSRDLLDDRFFRELKCDNGCLGPITYPPPLKFQECLKNPSCDFSLYVDVSCERVKGKDKYELENAKFTFKLGNKPPTSEVKVENPRFVYVSSFRTGPAKRAIAVMRLPTKDTSKSDQTLSLNGNNKSQTQAQSNSGSGSPAGSTPNSVPTLNSEGISVSGSSLGSGESGRHNLRPQPDSGSSPTIVPVAIAGPQRQSNDNSSGGGYKIPSAAVVKKTPCQPRLAVASDEDSISHQGQSNSQSESGGLKTSMMIHSLVTVLFILFLMVQ